MVKPRVFLDANIFVAATKSPQGGSRLILNLAKEKKIEIVTVRHALGEAERNIELKFGRGYLLDYYRLLIELSPTIQSIKHATIKDILALGRVVPRKDIPITLGALHSKCAFLITLDKKDLLGNKNLIGFPFKIITPGEFIQKYLI